MSVLQHNDSLISQSQRRNETMKNLMEKRYFPVNNLKWNPQKTKGMHFSKSSSISDNCDTPRTVNKKFKIDRSWNRKPWVHNKNNIDSFESHAINKDKDKGKSMKRLMKKRNTHKMNSLIWKWELISRAC